jgi:hypothetical protein
MNWSGGDFRGFAGMIINSGATLNITNTVGIKGDNLITNNGTMIWGSGSTIQYGAGGTNAQIQNNGIFNINDAAGIVDAGGGSNTFYFTNEASGTINKTTGNTTINAGTLFQNSGTVNITSGSLNVGQFFSPQDGVYNVGAAGELTGGTINFTGSTFSNSGLVSNNEINFSGGSVQTLTGNGQMQTMRMSSGWS